MKPTLLYLFLLGTFFTSFHSSATLWNVAPDSDYPTPNALYLADQVGDITIEDYDSIYIYEQTYSGTDALAAWQQNNLYIYSLGDGAALEADGAYILGKGTWVCAGDDITISNIEFSGAAVPDENGAGIRLDGNGLTLLNCYFHHNENGILAGNTYEGDILIQFCEFAYNGFGDGYTHNMYIGHVNSFTLSHCYSHHTNVGHNVKSRADNNYILYNRITDEEDGNSSRLIDLPNGGYALVKGNSLMQGPAALNNNAVGYGLEGLSNPAPHEFNFVHNTMVNKRAASCLFLAVAEGTTEAYVVNNIFAGTGELLDGEATFSHNYANTDISIFEFTGEEIYEYELANSSPVIDSGMVLTGDLIPEFHYFHEYYVETARDPLGLPDIGAYEYIFPIGISENEADDFLIYPNPSNGQFYIRSSVNIDQIEVFNSLGKRVFITTEDKSPIVLNQAPGTYILQITYQNRTTQRKFNLN